MTTQFPVLKRPQALLMVFLLTLFQGPLWAEAKKAQKPAKATSTSEEPPLAPMDQPLILVDGKPITHRDFMGYMQAHPDVIARASDSEQGKAEAYRELVGAFLLERAMYEEGLLKKGEPATQQIVVEAYEKLAERHFPLPPTPDDQEGFAYYQTHQNLYGIPPMFRINEILIKLPADADPSVAEAARQKAQKALSRIEKGESFIGVATEVTENPIGKATKGDLGFVDPKEERWIGNALDALKVGGHTPILTSPRGLVILQVSDIRPGLISPYANVRDQVVKYLRDQKQKELRDPYVKQLAKRSKIEIVLPDLKRLFPQGIYGE